MKNRASALAMLIAGFLVTSTGSVASGQIEPGATEPVVRYDGHKVYRVTVKDQREYLAVTSLADDVWTHSPGLGGLDVQVSPAKQAALEGLGLPTRVLIADVQGLLDAERAEILRRRQQRDLAWFQNYKTLAEINTQLSAWSTAYPAMASTFVVGNSLENRQIRGVKITGPESAEYPKASRPQILFNGCQHAREWISPMVNMYLGDQFLIQYASGGTVKDLLDRVEIVIVPVVNPDGYEYTWTTNRLWRKNRRNNGGSFGVDLNRNWGYQWGGEGASTSPSDETYRGASAFSEPETQAMRDMVLANTRLRAAIDFHSYSQLILSPWSYTSTLPPDSSIFNQLNASMQSAIQGVHGQFYDAGPTYTTIYPASGASGDWYYGAGSTPRKILAWGFELRDTGTYGFVLPADQIIPNGEEIMAGMIDLASAIAFPAKISLPDGVPSFVEANATSTVRVNVSASPGETLNASSLKSYARVGSGSFAPTALASLGGSLYSATLPAAGCGAQVQFYIEAMTTSGKTVRLPADAPAAFYSTPAAELTLTLDDPCEVNNGWSLTTAGDNATTGRWELADPIATAAQPGDDHSASGTKCFVTDGRGGAVGDYDIDGGKTTLTSPAFNGLGSSGSVSYGTIVSYWRWYSNNQGSNPGTDNMPVEISNDNGATWHTLETVTENAGAWVSKSFVVDSIVAPSAAMKIRFVAQDLGGGSIVEAAVDDVRVTVASCPLDPADVNGDGFVNGDDYDLFAEWFDTADLRADFNHDGFVNGDDYDAFAEEFEN
ncbi:MAG: hypothetical protein IT434_11850 [Phycisphaerales bacterium]|jgi:murein tripeptide amidase MpaA|nr:hypothetical protein [Phycisphaerales bacterium]